MKMTKNIAAKHKTTNAIVKVALNNAVFIGVSYLCASACCYHCLVKVCIPGAAELLFKTSVIVVELVKVAVPISFL